MSPYRKMRSFGEKADNCRGVLLYLSSRFIVKCMFLYSLLLLKWGRNGGGYKELQCITVVRILKVIHAGENHIKMWARKSGDREDSSTSLDRLGILTRLTDLSWGIVFTHISPNSFLPLPYFVNAKYFHYVLFHSAGTQRIPVLL